MYAADLINYHLTMKEIYVTVGDKGPESLSNIWPQLPSPKRLELGRIQVGVLHAPGMRIFRVLR